MIYDLTTVKRFAADFHSWLRHSWKSVANRLTRDPEMWYIIQDMRIYEAPGLYKLTHWPLGYMAVIFKTNFAN